MKDLKNKYNKQAKDEKKKLDALLKNRDISHRRAMNKQDKILAAKREQMNRLAEKEVKAAKKLRKKNLSDFESKRAERDAILLKEIGIVIRELNVQITKVTKSFDKKFKAQKKKLLKHNIFYVSLANL